MKTYTRYTLMQVPGWIGAGLILYAVRNWFGFNGWIALAIFAAFVAKDFVLYPFLKRAYEARWSPGPLHFIGEHGEAAEDVDPAGYVRVRGELWMAEVARGAAPVSAGARIRVQAVRGEKLIVVEDPLVAAAPGGKDCSPQRSQRTQSTE